LSTQDFALERGTLRVHPEGDNTLAIDEYGRTVAIACFMEDPQTGKRSLGEKEANLARLVACWNACYGIPTEKLSVGMIQTVQFDLRRAREIVERSQEALTVIDQVMSFLQQPEAPPTPVPSDGWAHGGKDDSVDGLLREMNGMLCDDRHEQVFDQLSQNQLEAGDTTPPAERPNPAS
jgi:hypothetical protein